MSPVCGIVTGLDSTLRAPPGHGDPEKHGGTRGEWGGSARKGA